MKIALVHDYLSQNGGAEFVLKVLHEMFPDAPIFVLFADRTNLDPAFARADIRESFFARLPMTRTHYQWYLPIMPSATESHDLSSFDLVISSSSAFAKGVLTGAHTTHICYCHTPTRYLWSDTHSYIKNLPHPFLFKKILPMTLSKLRVWDKIAADRVDFFTANSKTVAGRIQKYYHRNSRVIYPPVAIHEFAPTNAKPENYFLAGGRLVAYKKFDWIIEAFNRLALPLKIFGDGVAKEQLKSIAGTTIEFTGRVSDSEKARLYANAQAFINPQEEDFGITAIESMASGRPVIALPRGGALETMIAGVTGIFMKYDGWEGVLDAILHFDASQFDPRAIRGHAEKFSVDAFKTSFFKFIDECLHGNANR